MTVVEFENARIKDRRNNIRQDYIIKFQYDVPQNAKGTRGPSGTIIMKFAEETKKCIWGYQLDICKYPRNNVRFYKRYVSNISILPNDMSYHLK